MFIRDQKDEYIYRLEDKLKHTEFELKEMIEKRNNLEIERIQLLDKVAELQISLGILYKYIMRLFIYIIVAIMRNPIMKSLSFSKTNVHLLDFFFENFLNFF